MLAEIPTPTCDITGLPLPILQTELPGVHHFSTSTDYHHHFHRRKDPLLQGLGGKAVRYSRGQFLPREYHDRYHQLFSGPPLPETDAERFRLCVLACAGVVPRQAIDLCIIGEYEVVSLSNEDHRRLAAPRSIYVESSYTPHRAMRIRQKIGRFFAVYALEQNLRGVVSDRVTDQFLDERTSPERKKELGNFILREVLGTSIDDIVPFHQELRRDGFVVQERPRPLLNVVRDFFTNDFFPDYHDTVARSLRSTMGEAA